MNQRWSPFSTTYFNRWISFQLANQTPSSLCSQADFHMCGLWQCQAVMERWPVLYACGCLCVKNLPARCLPMFSSSLEKSESWSCRARLGVWGLVPLIGFTSDAQTGWRYSTHTRNSTESHISFEFHSFFTYYLWLQHCAISVIMRANYFFKRN